MISIPANNTTDELSRNDQLCDCCFRLNCLLNFQIFRLYLPRFPRRDVNTIIEIPLSLSRQFAVGIENFYFNSIDKISKFSYDHYKLKEQLKSDQSNKFISICIVKKMIKTNGVNCKKQSLNLSLLRHEYILNSSRAGSIKVEIFKSIPAKVMKNLIENCKDQFDMQCCWFINVVGGIYLNNQNIFMTITENCRLDLDNFKKFFHQKKDTMDSQRFVDTVLFIAAELLIAIDFLHERNLTHKLLTTKNIYFDFHGHLKLGNISDIMNSNRDSSTVFDKLFRFLENDRELTENVNWNYLDAEVHAYLLKGDYLGAYFHMDCLADIFSIGIIIIEILSDKKFLSFDVWNDVSNLMTAPRVRYSNIIDIFLKGEMQNILKQKLSEHCGFISPEFNAFLLLMLQPKQNRMRGLRIKVQRHKNLIGSGCEYKLRLDLTQRHPAFNRIDLNRIRVQASPVLQILIDC